MRHEPEQQAMIDRLKRLIEEAERAILHIESGLVVNDPNYKEPGMEYYDFRIGHFRIKENKPYCSCDHP